MNAKPQTTGGNFYVALGATVLPERYTRLQDAQKGAYRAYQRAHGAQEARVLSVRTQRVVHTIPVARKGR
jgi:hypothetical protein